ncbi:MAG: hypothetical protein RL326_1766 [Pseudomonadota bacterium]|jgi:predicted RNA-binding Zn-ribbon protein involved in translation (DUF1610 family)
MASALKTFPCPSCGSVISVRAYGISISFVCESCGGIIEAGERGGARLAHAAKKGFDGSGLVFPLGSRGTLDDIEWEVIGCMRRKDVDWKFYWDEYLLFNPYEGFRFLINSSGHFALATMQASLPDLRGSASAPIVDGVGFKLYHRGVSEVVEVTGEFYWRVRIGERAGYADHIAPPLCFTLEVPNYDKDEIAPQLERNYSLVSYIERGEVCKAFGISSSSLLQCQSGVFPFQPNHYKRNAPLLWLWFGVASVILFFLQLSLASTCASYGLLSLTRDIAPTERDQEITLGEVTLTKPLQNIQIHSRAPVSNSWVEVEYELESLTGDESAWISQPIEYYFGRDSDGAWSEGGQSTTSVGGPLSAKTYKVLATVDAQSLLAGNPIPLSVSIRADVPIYGNFAICIFLLLIPPMLVSLLSGKFERDRWAESDFSPYDD